MGLGGVTTWGWKHHLVPLPCHQVGRGITVWHVRSPRGVSGNGRGAEGVCRELALGPEMQADGGVFSSGGCRQLWSLGSGVCPAVTGAGGHSSQF